MTEDEVADRLRAFLVSVDAEATKLQPSRQALTDVIFSHQTAPRPLNAYALITSLGYRDAGEADWSCFDEVTLDAQLRIVETKTRVLEYGFRVDVYAVRAGATVRLFAAALRSAKMVELLPLVVRDVTRAGRDAELVTQHWEERANFTVTLAANSSDDVVIDVIEGGTVDFERRGATMRAFSRFFNKP